MTTARKLVDRLGLGINSVVILGVFAPVGLAISRNFSMAKNGRWNFSRSLFTSIIDIGALASFRLNNENDEVSTLPEIKLENIVSPGLYGVLGLPRIPISIGGGYQVGPVLSEVSADKLTLGSKSKKRSVFIAVDIPLLNFWTKPGKFQLSKKGQTSYIFCAKILSKPYINKFKNLYLKRNEQYFCEDFQFL